MPTANTEGPASVRSRRNGTASRGRLRRVRSASVVAQKKNRFLKKRDPRHGRTPQQYQDFILTPSSDFTNFNLDFKPEAIAEFLNKVLFIEQRSYL